MSNTSNSTNAPEAVASAKEQEKLAAEFWKKKLAAPAVPYERTTTQA